MLPTLNAALLAGSVLFFGIFLAGMKTSKSAPIGNLFLLLAYLCLFFGLASK